MITINDKNDILAYMRGDKYRPLTAEEFVSQFNINEIQDIKHFFALLRELELDGEIFLSKNHRYHLPDDLNLVVGKLQSHARGFAFVIPDDRSQEDVFVAPNSLNGAMNNDRVAVRIKQKLFADGHGPEGEIFKILTRANASVVGTIDKKGHYTFVIPTDRKLPDIYIPRLPKEHIKDGDLVVVTINVWPGEKRSPEGRITQIIGSVDTPGTDILAIIKKHDLPEEFGSKVLQQAENIADTISAADLEGRKDYRGILTITIDGEDAKDLDDAVSLEILPDGNYLLGVHIADVSYYVGENTALDKEARSRGCSVYLVDRVLPMLPSRLSNHICSLNPQVDRLTMSCVMEIDPLGQVVNYEIGPSVINSDERMTYSDVFKLLENEDAELNRRYERLLAMLNDMKQLCLVLRNQRMERGAVDFDFPEPKIILDENGDTVDIILRERTIAEQIIEEFMIKANETVAQHFYWLDVPFIYRTHDLPDSEKVDNLNIFLYNFGYSVKGAENLHPKAFQAVLQQVKGKKEERIISTIMLRSMRQARYEAEHGGHFGLASEYYTHFTSPIRRYPDLMIHRIAREVIGGRLTDKRRAKLEFLLPGIAENSSDKERAAMEAEMETDDLKKVEYMMDKVGEVFHGNISSVTSFGIFVQLPNTVEGLVRINSMHDDYYIFHEDKYMLTGEHKKKVYRLGDEVTVQLVKANLAERQLDFELFDGDDC